MDGNGNTHFRTACDYVHFNPLRARLVPPEQQLRDYAWSSLVGYVEQ